MTPSSRVRPDAAPIPCARRFGTASLSRDLAPELARRAQRSSPLPESTPRRWRERSLSRENFPSPRWEGPAIPVYIELVEIERKLSDSSQLWRDIQAAAEFGLTDERSPLPLPKTCHDGCVLPCREPGDAPETTLSSGAGGDVGGLRWRPGGCGSRVRRDRRARQAVLDNPINLAAGLAKGTVAWPAPTAEATRCSAYMASPTRKYQPRSGGPSAALSERSAGAATRQLIGA